MGPAERPGSAAAARLRGTGPGAFERAHRTLPRTVRGAEHAGLQLHHARAILSPAAQADVRRLGSPRYAQAARPVHSEESAASSEGSLDRARVHGGRI